MLAVGRFRHWAGVRQFLIRIGKCIEREVRAGVGGRRATFLHPVARLPRLGA